MVILRYNTGESIFNSRSRCFSCGKKLAWYELLPIASFLIQAGRCRKCKSKLSWQYPLIETTTGLLFLLIFLNLWKLNSHSFQTMGVQLPYIWLLISLLIVIAVYDLRHKIIPNKIVWLFNISALLFIFFDNWSLVENWSLKIENFAFDILSGLAFFSFFAILWLVSKGKWMGFGDAKLALGLGWILGPEKTILAFLFSFWLGAVFGIFLMLFRGKKYGMKSQIPFGPFLVAGSLLAFFVNINIMDWLYVL